MKSRFTFSLHHIIFLGLFSIVACSRQEGPQSENNLQAIEEESQSDNAEELSPALTMVWETDTVLTTVESVLYDASSDRIYASCIDGNPTDKDGNGFISILDKSGKITNLEWVNGLNAPKGMAILNNRLYVTDIDRLVEINAGSGEILNYYPVEGASFLNDVTTDGKAVFFSDMGTGKLHAFSNGKVITYASGLDTLNGIVAAPEGTIFCLYADGLAKLNTDGTKEIINTAVTNGDGLIRIDSTAFLASRWEGEIYLISGGREYLLLDTKAQSYNSADIGWLPEERVILVPTFFRNKVVGYRLAVNR